MVSRCFPGGYNVKLYISRGRLAWWLLAFCAVNTALCSNIMTWQPWCHVMDRSTCNILAHTEWTMTFTTWTMPLVGRANVHVYKYRKTKSLRRYWYINLPLPNPSPRPVSPIISYPLRPLLLRYWERLGSRSSFNYICMMFANPVKSHWDVILLNFVLSIQFNFHWEFVVFLIISDKGTLFSGALVYLFACLPVFMLVRLTLFKQLWMDCVEML